MSGIQYVTDEKGRKVGVLIDLKKHGAIWEDFWDGLVSESRRKEKGVPYDQYRKTRLKRTGSRGKYGLEIKPSAQRELDMLDDAMFDRIDRKILALAGNPRPPDARN